MPPNPTPNGDSLHRYILAAARPFEDLRDVASQLAGLMVLAASGARAATLDHPMLAVARETFRSADDAARALAPPPGGRHHHHHLLAAATALDAVFATMTAPGSLARRLIPCLPMLQAAWREIESAAAALPGFRTIDLEQSCCAAHARPRRSAAEGSTR